MKKFFITLGLLSLLLLPAVGSAQDASTNNSQTPPVKATACDGTFNAADFASGNIFVPPFLRSADGAQNAGFDCIGAGISYYTSFLLLVIALAAFFYLLYGAFLYVSAFGDEGKVGQAKKVITNALIGVVLSTLAFALINIVKAILKVS